MRPRIAALLLVAGIASGCTNASDDGADPPPCVKKHPRVDSDIEASVLSQTIDDCESDDGACQASIECTGSVKDRICDADRLISPSAALCIASEADFPPGLHGHEPQVVYNYAYRRVIWNVSNVLRDEGAAGSSGNVMVIDAVSGEVLATLGWAAMP